MNNKVYEVLLNSKIEDNKLYLPEEQLDRKDYLALNKELTALGGDWKGGKIKAFVFNFNPQLIVDKLTNSSTSIKKSLQFFPTPNKIVLQMLNEIDILKNDKILEPSAGQGAIISELLKYVEKVSYCEFEDINKQIIERKFTNKVKFLEKDFLKLDNVKFDKIFANPPFSKSQDITHIQHMYELLNDNGVLVSLSGTSWKNKNDKKSINFKEWINSKKHSIEEIPAGEFSESGTMISTLLLKIYK